MNINEVNFRMNSKVKKILTTGAATALLFGNVAMPAFAETLPTIDFESYNPGIINNQDGWTSTGAAGSGCAVYDHKVDDSLGTTGFGLQSLRISNAVTSGCFGDQTFAKPLTNAVGEADSTNGTYSAGTLQSHFEMEFDIASTIKNALQPGLFVSVSPDRGDGSRMSYVGFEDTEDGIDIIFYDVQGETQGFQLANFVLTDLGTYDRTVSHHIKLVMDMVDGSSNDVVKVYVDGVLEHTGTSWENYYRFDTEAIAEQSPRIVKTAIFRTGGDPAPGTTGNGFLFDNISLSSGPTPVDPFAIPVECSNIEGLGAPIIGTNKSEVINGTNGNDLIFALGGSDKVTGNGGNDCIVGGAGSDKLLGNNGDDVILGGDGGDSIEGNNGEDMLFGGAGSDSLRGGGQNDELFGGGGSDSLRGDGGTDEADGGLNSDACNAETETACEG